MREKSVDSIQVTQTQEPLLHFLIWPPKLYGWASVTLSTGGFSGIVTINNWAYEDSGAGINMGAIPESSDVALGLGGLALGAVGLRSWRKNKAKRKT